MYLVSSKILSNIEVSPTYYKMGLNWPEIATRAAPGQFVMVRVCDRFDPFLRRPFAIHRIKRAGAGGEGTPGGSRLEILYRTVGKGTNIMSEMREGDEIDLLGPVGNGYRIESNSGITILVAGGIGVASLLALAEKIASQSVGMKSILLFLGGKGRDDVLCVEDFEGLGIEVRVATEDGSLGCRGLVSDLMLDYLESGNYGLPSRTHCFACGPESMLKEVARIAGQKGIPCQVSMESRMACGLGACLGCVVKTRANVQNLKSEHNLTRDDQQLITGYKRVCKDGPIFDSNEVIWE